MSIQIEFIKMTFEDIPTVIKWIQTPHVHKYWYSAWNKTDEELYKKYETRLLDSLVETFIIQYSGKKIGLIQTYYLDKNNDFYVQKPAKGIDMFIGEKSYIGKGLGTLTLELFIERHIFNNSKVEFACIDPELANKKAIHVYEKVGFKQSHISVDHVSGLLTSYMILKRSKEKA